ncbi:cobalamin biosynthesis protein [Parasphingorhabdus pacifica]
MIGLFAATTTGRRAAAELAARLGPDAVLVDGPVGPALRRAWTTLDGVVLFVDTSSAVRLIGPLLGDESTDPGVVCVDDDRRFAVAVAGGRSGGANALTQQVADVLDCVPVTVVGSLAVGPLDELADEFDATVDGDLAACGAAVLDGEPVRLLNPHGFPLPALPSNVAADPENPMWTVVLDDRRPDEPDDDRTVRIIPRTLVVGIGSSRGVSRTTVTDLIAGLDTAHGLDPRAVRAFATVEHKADETGILEAVQDMGFWHTADGGDELPLLTFSTDELAEVEVPTPSDLVRAATGTPSVAEAAAVLGAREMGGGAGVEFAAPKTKNESVAVAACRVRPRGRLAVIGIGPGPPDLRTPRAETHLHRVAVVVGRREHLDDLHHLLRAGTRLHPTARNEADRLDEAMQLARAGNAVALLAPGDGELSMRAAQWQVTDDIDLVHVPGVAERDQGLS